MPIHRSGNSVTCQFYKQHGGDLLPLKLREKMAWDDDTNLPLANALNKHLYGNLPAERKEAWLARVRDWEHGWLKVLKTSGDHLREVMTRDLGVEVETHQPKA